MAFNNNRKKERRNYFSQNIHDNGENFLSSKTAQDMLRDAARIIKDLANENIDINKYYYFFQEPIVIDSCIQYVWSQLQEFKILSECMEYCMMTKNPGVIPDQLQSSIRNKYSQKASIFQHIYDSLQRYKFSKDINVLYGLANSMNSSRYYINN